MKQTFLNQRQQQAIEFKVNTVVGASAGTGKTRTLVGLYLKLLDSGLEPENILAITFTEKAAAEMRERVRQAIRAKLATTETEEIALWRQKLSRIVSAPISTIHAFCTGLLRDYPIESRLDPRFVVLPEPTANDLLRRTVFSVIHDRITAEDPDVQDLFRDFQLERGASQGPRRLLEIVEDGLAWLNGLGIDLSSDNSHSSNWLEQKWIEQNAAIEALKKEFKIRTEEVQRALRLIAQVHSPAGENANRWVSEVRAHLDEIERFLSGLSPESEAHRAVELEQLLTHAKPGKISQEPENQVLIANLQLVRDALDPERENSLLNQFGAIKGAPLALKLIDLISLCQRKYHQAKTENHSLDFDDLLLNARQLLKFNLAVRRICKERFKAILVDEFQDTDEIQGELVALLGESLDSECAFERDDSYRSLLQKIDLTGGRLFIVGDPKQSIYRFRRANVSVFVHLKERILASGGDFFHLAENYRSQPHLLDLSNSLFSFLMDGTGIESLPEEEDLTHRICFGAEEALSPPSEGGSADSTLPTGEAILLVADPNLKAAQGRAEEARAIAQIIQGGFASGRWQSYNQLALLLRKRGRFDVYQAALEEMAIPSYVIQGMGFYQRQEISDLISLLSFVRNPNDDLALSEVLTSPLVGWDFDQLLELADFRRQGRFSSLYLALVRARAVHSAWGQNLKAFAPLMDTLLYLRDRLEPAEMLSKILLESGYSAVLAGQADGEQRLANARKLVEIAHELGRSGLMSLDEVVDRLKERQRLGDDMTSEAQIIGEKENVVRIMTVHQAKGLEFDTVFLPDLGSAVKRESAERVGFSEQCGIIACAAYGVRRDRLPNLMMHSYLKRETDKEYEESKRLFYVATTRAKRNLVLGEGSAHGNGVWKQWLAKIIKLDPAADEALERVRSGVDSEATINRKQFSLRLMSASRLADRGVEEARPPLNSPLGKGGSLEWSPVNAQIMQESDSRNTIAPWDSPPHLPFLNAYQASSPLPIREGGKQEEILFEGGSLQSSVTPQESDIGPMDPELDQVLKRAFYWIPNPPKSIELSPTALSDLTKCQRYFYLHHLSKLSEHPPSRTMTQSTRDLGNLVHQVLERFPVQTANREISSQLNSLLNGEPDYQGIEAAEQTSMKLDLERFLKSSLWKRISWNPSFKREVPFVLALGRPNVELLIRGRMDAFAMEAKHAVMLDYKYSNLSENKAEQFRVPMEIYANALMQATKCASVETGLVFLREPGEGIVWKTIHAGSEIEDQLLNLAEIYQQKIFSGDINSWEKIEHSHCDALKCGFRSYCWG